MAYNSVFCAAELKKRSKEVDQVSLSVARKHPSGTNSQGRASMGKPIRKDKTQGRSVTK